MYSYVCVCLYVCVFMYVCVWGRGRRAYVSVASIHLNVEYSNCDFKNFSKMAESRQK